MKRIAISVLLLMALVLSSAGCVSNTSTNSATDQSTQSPSSSAAPIEVHAAQVKNPPQQLTGSGGRLIVTPEAGDVYVAFNCTVIQRDPKSPNVISRDFFALHDQQNREYVPVYGDYNSVQLFPTRVNTTGAGPVSGLVFFEVPANHGTWKDLTYVNTKVSL